VLTDGTPRSSQPTGAVKRDAKGRMGTQPITRAQKAALRLLTSTVTWAKWRADAGGSRRAPLGPAECSTD